MYRALRISCFVLGVIAWALVGFVMGCLLFGMIGLTQCADAENLLTFMPVGGVLVAALFAGAMLADYKQVVA